MESSSTPKSTEIAAKLKAPSKAILAAALSGLFAATTIAACSSPGSEPNGGDRPGDGGAGGGNDATGGNGGMGPKEPEVYNRVLKENATESDLIELCDEREGWLYRTAFCAGSGQCKGLFLLSGTLSEYSCKGMNGCGGMGCVEMPADEGRSGKEVYEKGGCENCHGKWSEDYSSVDMSYYQLIRPSTMSEEEKLAEFEGSSTERLVSILVFGTQGFYPTGEAYSNMPSYREKYAREELKRAAEYIRGLKLLPTTYDVPGGGGAGGAAP